MSTIAKLLVSLGLDSSEYHKGLTDSAQATDGFSKSLLAVGTVAAGVGLAAGTALVGVGIAGVKAFGSFQTGMSEVFTLLPDLSASAMSDMTADVKSFAKEFGVLPEEEIPALYQALSAGVPKDNVFDFLATAQKAAVGGVTELETAVDGITSVVNAYGPSVLSATAASDLMFTTVKLGKTNFEQLSSSLFNVIPTAASAGVSFADVSAALASITLQGTPTSVATTQIRSALVEASKGGTKLSQALIGLTGKSFPQLVAGGMDIGTIFQTLRKSMPDQEFKDLFGSVESLNAVLGITGPNAAGFASNLNAMKNSAGATELAYQTMNQTLGASAEKLKAFGAVFLIDIGEKLAPAVALFTNALIKLLNSQFVTDMINGLGLAIETAVNWIIIASTTGIPQLNTAFSTMSTVLAPLIGYVSALVSDGDTLNDWITYFPTILQPAIAVLGNYVVVWLNLANTISTVVGYLVGGDLAGAWQALISGLGLVVTSYETYVSSLYTLLSGVGQWLATNLPIWGAAFVEWITPYIPVALAMLETFAQAVVAWIGTQAAPIAAQIMVWGNALVAWITPNIPIVIGYLTGLGQSILDWIGATASTLLAGFTAWANALWVWVPPAIVQFLKEWPKMLDGFLDWIGSAAGPILLKLGDWALAFIQWVVPMIPDLLIALGGLIIALGIFIVQTAAVIANKIGNDWGPAFITWVVTTAIPGLLAALQGLKNSIDGWITATGLALRAQVVKIGTAIIEGIKAGISAAWEGLKSWFSGLVASLVPAAMSSIDARSPSRMFANQVGNKAIMGGILLGMEQGLPKLLAFIGKAGRKILSETLGVMASFTRSSGIDVFRSLLDIEKLDPFQPLVDATDALKTAQDQALGVSSKLLDLNAEIAELVSTPLDQIGDHLKYNEQLAKLYGEQAVLLNEQANAQGNLAKLGQTQAEAQAASVQQQMMINQIAERARQQYNEAQAQALTMMQTDAKSALAFFNARKAQIEELAQLEKERALATTDQQRADLDTQIALTRAAQGAEQTQQAVDIYISSQDQRAMGNEDILKIIQNALRDAGITVDIRARTA